ncbi:hypothetical protein [Cylindrospermopsis raciborskii]|uniref:hypothetical protein n=1 Tax=Cylindrospermopsis raciborskii TaxID=77022 RepID=UPI003AF32209
MNLKTKKAIEQLEKFLGETIQTLADFQKLPVICKEKYISVYSLPELCKDGKLGGCDMITASSCSVEKPTFWPRFFPLSQF